MIRYSLNINKQLTYIKEFYSDFKDTGSVLIPKEFYYLSDLGLNEDCSKPGAIAVWTAIQYYANKFGSSIKSVKTLSKRANISTASFRRYLNLLEKNHLVTIEKRYNSIDGGRETNRIFCNHPILASTLYKNFKEGVQNDTPLTQDESVVEEILKLEQSEEYPMLEKVVTLVQNNIPPSKNDTQTDVDVNVYNNTYINKENVSTKKIAKPILDIFNLFNKSGIKLDIHTKSIEVIELYILPFSEEKKLKLIQELKKYQDSGRIQNIAGWLIKNPTEVIKKALDGSLNKSTTNMSNNLSATVYQSIPLNYPIFTKENKVEKETDVDRDYMEEGLSLEIINKTLRDEGLSLEEVFTHSRVFKNVESLTKLSEESLIFMLQMLKENMNTNDYAKCS